MAGASVTELDDQQSKAARHQIDRIQKQLHRIDEDLLPETKPHVEPSATDHDPGTEHAGSEQTRERASPGDLPRGSAQSSALQLARPAGITPAREGRAIPAAD